jgi:RHS repeat-associated protein
MKIGADFYFYHNDHLGTPQKLTAVNGAVGWSAKYSSFGEADVDASSSITNNLRFAGQYYDTESGLHYNYNRFYDPTTGRYMSIDPIGFNGGINMYSYANINPINLIDPLGLFCKIEWTNPVAGGDPLREWIEIEKIGYWDALIQYVGVELILSRLKLSVPNLGIYEYTTRYTTLQLLKVYVNYWELCYDDCTGEMISKTHIGKGETGKTESVIVSLQEVKNRL